MTSSHEDEPLFDMTPDDSADEQPSTVSHIDIARKASKTGEVSDKELDRMADILGNYTLARVRLGLPIEDKDIDELPGRRHLPGKPLSFPKRGNVRDFHDGGRADEHRGGMGAPELGSEADDIMRRQLPELQARRDRIVEQNIREGFEDDVINSEFVGVDAARSRAISRYRGHLERHYPNMDSDMVNDILADFAETLLPPSPLQ
jgi:hypothetical protein